MPGHAMTMHPGASRRRAEAGSHAGAPRPRARAAAWVALAGLVALFGARLVHVAAVKSLTADEPHYIGTALYLWETGDYHPARSLRFHPPLAYHLAGLPLLALDLRGYERTADLGHRLVQGSEPGPARVRFVSRLPFVALACWGAVLVFLWGLEAAGPGAAVLGAFLYAFSPTLLGHGALAHSDIAVAVLFLQTLYLFWRWARRPGAVRLALCGISLGLALSAKLSALLLLPVLGLELAALAFGVRALVPGAAPVAPGAGAARVAWLLARGAALGACAAAVVWASYGGSFAWSEGGGRLAGVPIPGYLHALLFDRAANEAGRVTFFFGAHDRGGRWYALLVAFLVKTPLPFLALLGAAVFAGRRRAPALGPWLGLALAVYGAVALFWLKVPLGIRYLLPAIPLLHVFTAVRIGIPARRLPRALVALACAAVAAESAWIHPHHIAYFNPLVGGPARGYRALVESNLDWGQDALTLARELEARGNPAVWLAYLGPERPERYGVRARPLRGCAPVEGLVAISANVLQRLYDPDNPFRQPPPGCYDWLLAREPAGSAGYSILLYDVEDGSERDDGAAGPSGGPARAPRPPSG